MTFENTQKLYIFVYYELGKVLIQFRSYEEISNTKTVETYLTDNELVGYLYKIGFRR